jgi:aspartate aminotransferase-like enzyme
MKPSRFFTDFADEPECNSEGGRSESCSEQKRIEKMQRLFIRKKYLERNLGRLLSAADDLIALHGALSRSLSDGTTERIRLHYRADDLMAPYAADIEFFTKRIHPCSSTVRVFKTNKGVDWATV